jgi:hypothetical protein
VIVLIAVFLLSDRIERMTNARAAVLGVAAVVVGAGCATGYFVFANRYTVTITTVAGATERHIIPLNPSADIQRIVEPMDYKYRAALQISPERSELKRLMMAESGSSMVIMILLLVLSEVLLIAPIVGAGWKLASMSGRGGAPPPPARRRRSATKPEDSPPEDRG